jgi:hypothetical protein
LEGFASDFPEKNAGGLRGRVFAKIAGVFEGVWKKRVGKCGFLMVRLW